MSNFLNETMTLFFFVRVISKGFRFIGKYKLGYSIRVLWLLLVILLTILRLRWLVVLLLLIIASRRRAVALRQLIFAQQLLDFPYILLGANRELEIFLGDGIPVLVDHHHC